MERSLQKKKTQPIQTKGVEASPSGYKHCPQGSAITSEEGVEGLCKSQRVQEFAVRMHLLVMSEAPFIKSHQHDCLDKNDNRPAKQMGESPQGFNPAQRTTGK